MTCIECGHQTSGHLSYCIDCGGNRFQNTNSLDRLLGPVPVVSQARKTLS